MRKPDDFPFLLFGISGWEGLLALFWRCQNFMPKWKSTEAIFSALAFEEAYLSEQLNQDMASDHQLAQRRKTFADKNGISERTVMRLEEQGAAILDDYVRRFITPRTDAEVVRDMHAALIELQEAVAQSEYPMDIADWLEQEATLLRANSATDV